MPNSLKPLLDHLLCEELNNHAASTHDPDGLDKVNWVIYNDPK